MLINGVNKKEDGIMELQQLTEQMLLDGHFSEPFLHPAECAGARLRARISCWSYLERAKRLQHAGRTA